MIKYKYKEKTYAEEILKNGFSTNNLIGQLKILAKYYKHKELKPKEREEKLYEFCGNNIKNYNKVKYFKTVNSALNHARNNKNKLIEINEIKVSDKELQVIEGFNVGNLHKKVLFTMLVLDKLNKESQKIKYGDEFNNKEYYFGRNPSQYKELIESSKIPKGKSKKIKNIHSIIGDLNNEGVLESTNQGRIKLSFMYNIPDDDLGVITINSFDNIGLYYDLHIGENKVKKCECCETPIKVKSNRTKFCDTCFEDNWREYNAKKQREYRENKKRV
ncbi:hypothetical protein [Metabacillus arenae]|uniref:Uncharacterized protein n=1 Tax=Metabacillus arenae TaxID=2771434 RepID=A0A926NDK8_9BACI|nr:hypothetical protein [Metabacillus arenae]MBD1379195.1 hypothetical protein [Metabacillus arenae]